MLFALHHLKKGDNAYYSTETGQFVEDYLIELGHAHPTLFVLKVEAQAVVDALQAQNVKGTIVVYPGKRFKPSK